MSALFRRGDRLLAGALAVVLVAASLMLGEPFVGVNRLPHALTADGGVEHAVVVLLRAPRVVLAVFAGALLGVAGLLLQESLRNPLAVPEMLGVSSGAAAAVAGCVAWGVSVPGAPLVPALAGSAIGGAVTMLAVRGVRDRAAVLLIGAAVSAGLHAVMLTALSLSDSRDQGVLVRYLLGSLTGTTWETVATMAPGLLIGLPLAALMIPALGVLRLGDDTAAALGASPARARAATLAVGCLLTAVVVGPCGPVSWVGFLAPQLGRWLRPRGTHRSWLLWSAALGALLVVAADLLARAVLHPVELPVGGLTAVVAICAGVLLLLRRKASVVAR
ncbi:iron complex transport system permease protein [Saccharopolyspora kobensis]|uniref:Iron complex transport system permease protein n=1 Tax=Saccharopolyspora kobensis TaxID=146035 RepID=A0A1H6A0V4_9PSEU|nr:iron ABC transporter permease [Saccharopolyspora kobensis]SEG42349.1 iron complex transport system permease protein [Saccharopolyspora kobensis]SFE17770.1 iron complex transport system permease protein [Saccharopolyspora kobensis]